MYAKISRRIKVLLDDEVQKVIHRLGIPSKEEWSDALHTYNTQKEQYTDMMNREARSPESNIETVQIKVEDQFCSLCTRPHFQGGLCLLHMYEGDDFNIPQRRSI